MLAQSISGTQTQDVFSFRVVQGYFDAGAATQVDKHFLRTILPVPVEKQLALSQFRPYL